MPLVILQYKKGRGLKKLARKLAKKLPKIVAPNLTLTKRKRHDGQVSPKDIMVWCRKGKKADRHAKDLEIIVVAHDFPKRKANLEARKDAMIKGVRRFLGNQDVPGSAWVILAPTAWGEF